MREVPILRKAKQAEAQQLKQKALEPQQRQCFIMKKKVNILVEYPDYKGPHFKGPEGAIYCENILECYQKDIRCRYSGISPLFPDPFLPRDEEDLRQGQEEQADESDEPSWDGSDEDSDPGDDADLEDEF
jgi:hypothetical protein